MTARVSSNAIAVAGNSGSSLQQNTPQSGASAYISHRGLEHGLKPVLRYIPALVKALKNPYCPKTNPEGIIVMTMCENAQMVDEMIAKLGTRPLLNPNILHMGDFNGSVELKEGIRKFVRNEVSKNIILHNHHIHCLGGAGACIIAISKVLFNPGDSVLLIAPCYSPFFFDIGAASNVHCVPVSLDFPDFEMNFARLDRAYQRSIRAGHCPRALVVTNPSNPTGICLSATDLTKLLRWSRRRQLFYISSEVYSGIWHHDAPVDFPTDLMDGSQTAPPDDLLPPLKGASFCTSTTTTVSMTQATASAPYLPQVWGTPTRGTSPAPYPGSMPSKPSASPYSNPSFSSPSIACLGGSLTANQSSRMSSSSGLSCSSGIDFQRQDYYRNRFRTNAHFNPFVSIIDIAYEEAKASDKEVDLTKVLGDDILILWSASKSLGLSGFRVGATICQNALVHAAMTRYSTESQISRETQQTVGYLLNDEQWIRQFFVVMRQRLRLCCNLVEAELTRLAVPFIRPVGGLSFWIDLGEFIPLFHWKSQDPTHNWSLLNHHGGVPSGSHHPSVTEGGEQRHGWTDYLSGGREQSCGKSNGQSAGGGEPHLTTSSDRPPHEQLKEAEWLMFETICFTYRVALTPGLDFVPAPRPISVPKAFQLHGGDDTWVTSAGFVRMCFGAYAAPAIPVTMERLAAFIIDARAVIERMDVLAT